MLASSSPSLLVVCAFQRRAVFHCREVLPSVYRSLNLLCLQGAETRGAIGRRRSLEEQVRAPGSWDACGICSPSIQRAPAVLRGHSGDSGRRDEPGGAGQAVAMPCGWDDQPEKRHVPRGPTKRRERRGARRRHSCEAGTPDLDRIGRPPS